MSEFTVSLKINVINTVESTNIYSESNFCLLAELCLFYESKIVFKESIFICFGV